MLYCMPSISDLKSSQALRGMMHINYNNKLVCGPPPPRLFLTVL